MSKLKRILINGRIEWRLNNGCRHRKDGPAVIWPDSHKEWYLDGKRHREDGPAIEWPNGTKEWYLNGFLHREDGPAVIHSNGTREWWLNGVRHRNDGPTIAWGNGAKSWYLNDKYTTFDEYKQWFVRKISNPSYKLTDGDIEFIREYLE